MAEAKNEIRILIIFVFCKKIKMYPQLKSESWLSMTKLEKKYDFQTVQENCKKKWSESKIYSFEKNQKDVFSIDTPPPTISGSLHIGHVFSYCHTDFIARYKRMKGNNIFYPCGFDNNGLPTERLVEKKHKIKANNAKKEEFISLCNNTSDGKIDEFKDLFNQIGISFDWNLQYTTNDQKSRIVSQKSFLDLYRKGLIYRKQTPTFWDTKDQTAIAQAEIEDKEFESFMNYIDFYTEEGQKITIATTRPELLPACVAVLFNPEDIRYKGIENTNAITPLFGKKIPILADETVLQEKGTGLVMCCTFGDESDVNWWQKHKLPMINAIDKYGKISAFFGKKVEDARLAVIEQLKEKNLLVKQEKIVHSVKCAERSGAKLEIIPTWQWYIKILDHKKEILENAKKINWLPKKMQIKIEQWVDGIKWDWCISRQRYLGVPIPVFYDKKSRDIILPKEADLPIDNTNCQLKGYSLEELEMEKDVLDTWATSSLTPQINNLILNNNQNDEFLQMDLRPQAHEIIRTWAFYTITRTLFAQNTIPWKNIAISGWCLAHDKTKMSKSKGNTLDPIKLLERYGADVVRYWCAGAKPGSDTCYSENVFMMGKKLIGKIWNASKFVEQFFIKDFETSKITYPTDLWIKDSICNLVQDVEGAFEDFDYCSAKSLVESFFLKEYCDTYLELVKARAYSDLDQKQSAINTLSFSLEVFLKLFAPFFPYIVEEIYSTIVSKSESIHKKGSWQNYKSNENHNEVNSLDGRDLFYILGKVREFKSSKRLALNTPIRKLKISAPNQNLKEAEYDIKNACSAHEIEWNSTEDEILVEVTE